VTRVRGLALLAAVLAATALGCGSGQTEEVSPAPPTPETESSPASDRPTAPTIDGQTLDGDRVSLESFRGQPVLVNVWSSW